MKAYVIVTGLLYLLVVVVHVARAVAEGGGVFAQPVFVVATVLALGMAVWSWRVWRLMQRLS